MAAMKLALLSHGAAGYECHRGGFIVPPHVTLLFDYDPNEEDTVVCVSQKDIPAICAKPATHTYNPGDRCADLTLTRADDINYNTGLYLCESKDMWIVIPGLEGHFNSPAPDKRNIGFRFLTCLSTVVGFFSGNSQMEEKAGGAPTKFEIRVLACGTTTKSYTHPDRITAISPAKGLRETYSEYLRRTGMPAGKRLTRRKRTKMLRRKKSKSRK